MSHFVRCLVVAFLLAGCAHDLSFLDRPDVTDGAARDARGDAFDARVDAFDAGLDPCTSASTCASCMARPACGWCIAQARCLGESGTGPLSCPGGLATSIDACGPAPDDASNGALDAAPPIPGDALDPDVVPPSGLCARDWDCPAPFVCSNHACVPCAVAGEMPGAVPCCGIVDRTTGRCGRSPRTYWCHATSDCLQGECVDHVCETRAPGASCTQNTDCDTQRCESGTCTSCTADGSVPTAGAPCCSENVVSGRCQRNPSTTICSSDDVCISDSCVRGGCVPLRPGESCVSTLRRATSFDLGNEATCRDQLSCCGSTSCWLAEECSSYFCADGRCSCLSTRWSMTVAACRSNAECCSGICTNGQCECLPGGMRPSDPAACCSGAVDGTGLCRNALPGSQCTSAASCGSGDCSSGVCNCSVAGGGCVEGFDCCPSSNLRCQSGTCVCVPRCSGRTCGPDGCGGSCGSCGTNERCNASGTCERYCTCGGNNCGLDSCGTTSCGTCGAGQTCASGTCTSTCRVSRASCTPGGLPCCDGSARCTDVCGGNICCRAVGTACASGGECCSGRCSSGRCLDFSCV